MYIWTEIWPYFLMDNSIALIYLKSSLIIIHLLKNSFNSRRTASTLCRRTGLILSIQHSTLPVKLHLLCKRGSFVSERYHTIFGILELEAVKLFIPKIHFFWLLSAPLLTIPVYRTLLEAKSSIILPNLHRRDCSSMVSQRSKEFIHAWELKKQVRIMCWACLFNIH